MWSAFEEEERLLAKGKENWTEEDWESWHYIKNANAEYEYFDSLD